jgi:hypothetical protein
LGFFNCIIQFSADYKKDTYIQLTIMHNIFKMFLMNTRLSVLLTLFFVLFVITSCTQTNDTSVVSTSNVHVNTYSILSGQLLEYPKIASWLAKKDEIIASEKPYSLIMSGWFTPEESAQIKSRNPRAIILAGLSANWVWDNQDWMDFLLNVASYGRQSPFTINESMYLHKPDGSRCPFGWASEAWGQEEIYAMDPRNLDWVALVTSFYKNVLDQPQHDGIIIDMVTEKSWCPETISDKEWIEATSAIFRKIRETNIGNKPVIMNAGRDLSEIDAYAIYMDGFLMENFMGEQLQSTFEEGLKAAESNLIIIYAVDTDDTGTKNLSKMRLGLVLSMMHDNTYFTYDFGPRDHGQAWWFAEYDIDLGKPLGDYYRKGDAYYREFEKATIVAAPYSNVTVSFSVEHINVSNGEKAISFSLEKYDAAIYSISE